MLAAYLPGAALINEGRPDLGAPLLHQAIELLETDPVRRDDPRYLTVSLLCPRWLMDPSSAVGYAERRINRPVRQERSASWPWACPCSLGG